MDTTTTRKRKWTMCEEGSGSRLVFRALVIIVGLLCFGRVAEAEEIGGNWYATENATILFTVCALGECDQLTQNAGGSEPTTITQNGANVSWYAPGTHYLRSGTINGKNIQVSGVLCALRDVPFPGDFTFTSNLLTAQGALSADNTTITLTGTGSCQGYGTYEGIPFTLQAVVQSDSVVMTRPAVSIAATDPTATEAGRTPGAFTVTRAGSTASPLAVTYTVGGTATNGTDYTSLSGSVTIPAGAGSATITVTPIADSLAEGDETVVVTLSANPNYGLGAANSATVTIADAPLTIIDFNADGHADLLWQDATSGDVYVWFMNGTTHTGGAYLAHGMGPWKLVATGDLCGSDGKPDLLWQHETTGDVYLWCMNGTTQTSGMYLAQGMAPWKIVGSADLTGDGKPDLLWQHATTGDVYVWFLNGTTVTGGAYLAQSMSEWQVVATADLTADGKPDLLWQHATTGDVYVWFMNGTTQTGGAYLAQDMGPWKVVATADLNADGKPDLLWQDSTTGDVYVWFLNGTTPTGGAYIARGMGPWKVVGPK